MHTDIEEAPRVMSLAGLLFSLIIILGLAGLLLGLVAGVIALIDLAFNGWDHLIASLDLVSHLSRRDGSVELIGFLFGCAIYAAVLGALALASRWRWGGLWLWEMGWRPFRPGSAYWGFVAIVMAYGVGASLALSQFHATEHPVFSMPESWLGIGVSFLLIVVCAPLAEEWMFRGWIWAALRPRGFRVTLWTTALVFAAAHWGGTPFYSLAILPIGLVLGLLREKSGSTQATTLCHALYNFLMWGLTFLGKA